MSRCSEAEFRGQLEDGEFWDYVFNGVGPGDDPKAELEDMEPVGYDELDILARCEVCGEPGACGYDLEGRPLIHTSSDEVLMRGVE